MCVWFFVRGLVRVVGVICCCVVVVVCYSVVVFRNHSNHTQQPHTHQTTRHTPHHTASAVFRSLWDGALNLSEAVTWSRKERKILAFTCEVVREQHAVKQLWRRESEGERKASGSPGSFCPRKPARNRDGVGRTMGSLLGWEVCQRAGVRDSPCARNHRSRNKEKERRGASKTPHQRNTQHGCHAQHNPSLSTHPHEKDRGPWII